MGGKKEIYRDVRFFHGATHLSPFPSNSLVQYVDCYSCLWSLLFSFCRGMMDMLCLNFPYLQCCRV